ncbi:hypothetical protein ACWDAE_26280, partial [Rhodococcus indonesiensis]
DPALMASAMRHAVEAGFRARLAGRIPKRFWSIQSTRCDIRPSDGDGRQMYIAGSM